MVEDEEEADAWEDAFPEDSLETDESADDDWQESAGDDEAFGDEDR